MRPAFRDTADKKLADLKFTESMRLSVIVRGRRRVHYTRRIVAAAAALIIMLTGITAFITLRPDAAPDYVAAPGNNYEYHKPAVFSSENFDIYVTDFDRSGMNINIAYSLVSRADYDALVIRSPFHDDEIMPQNEATITETACEPEFPTFAEQAIYLPAGARLTFKTSMTLSEWKPGEELLPTARFDFIKPAIEFTPSEYLTLTGSPLLIKLDDIHVDVARAVTEKADNLSTVMPENEQIVVRDWPGDDWLYYKSCEYEDMARWLAADGIAADEGENIEISFVLADQPATLTVMCSETTYNSAAAEVFCVKNPDIQLLRIDPDSDTRADIMILDTTDPEFTELLDTENFLPYISESRDLKNLHDSLYASVSSSLSRTDFGTKTPAALPVSMTFETYLSWYPSGFAQLGLSEDDVPETWLDLLIFLQKLPEINAGSKQVTAFEWHMSVDEVKRTIFDGIIYACAIEMNRSGEDFDPDHHYIRRLMLEFEKIDFEALCLPIGSAADNSGSYLFGLHGAVSPAETEYTRPAQRPMALALFSKFEPVVNASISCVLISADCDSYPYAIEYVELLMHYRTDDYDSLFLSDYTPTAESGITEESLAWYREYIENLELTPPTIDPDTTKYLYDLYFYADK